MWTTSLTDTDEITKSVEQSGRLNARAALSNAVAAGLAAASALVSILGGPIRSGRCRRVGRDGTMTAAVDIEAAGSEKHRRSLDKLRSALHGRHVQSR